MRDSAKRRDSTRQKPGSSIKTWQMGLLIAIATFLAYWPALRGEIIWDDDSYLSENKVISEPGLRGLTAIWTDYTATPQYYPLVFTSYWVEYRLWGLHTLGYHINNVLLHVCSAILLGRLLSRLKVPGAWLAAAVFALHPVNVESVAWITERKNALCGLFYVLCLSAYSRFSGLEKDECPRSLNIWQFALCMLLFIGALLSKTVTASLPAVLLLMVWWRRGRVTRVDLKTLAPMFMIGAGMGLFTAWLEKHHVGAQGHEWRLTLLDRFLLATRSPWFYASKIVWPWTLSFIYPRWQIDSRQVWQYIFPLATIATIAILWNARRRIGRGPLVVALCFVGTLFPALGFFNVFPFRYSFVADHFQYIAGGFLIVGSCYLLARLARRMTMPARMGMAGCLLLLCGARSYAQAKVYQGMYSLWSSTVASNPGAWMAHGNLGDYFYYSKRYVEAIQSYERGLALEAFDANQMRFNMGLAYEKLGRIDEAIATYRKAIEIDPKYAEAHVNLGVILGSLGRRDEAIRELREAVRIKPQLAEAHYNLGNLLVEMSNIEDGRSELRAAIRAKPDYWEAWINEAGLAWTQGQIEEAIKLYREIRKRNPANQEALINLGSALVETRQIPEGLELLREAVKNRPDAVEPAVRLIKALFIAGRNDEAQKLLGELIRRAPNDPMVRQITSGPVAKPKP